MQVSIRVKAVCHLLHGRKLIPEQVKPLVQSCVWLLLALTIWSGLDHYNLDGTWKQRMLLGLVVPPVLIAWSVWRQPDSVKLWRRRLRKARRALR